MDTRLSTTKSMTIIKLITQIDAPLEKCFDLARDIDFHQRSAGNTKEKVIAGKMSGLCELGDQITWEATHFGIRQNLSIKITKFDHPYFFQDEMTRGAFKKMQHEHHFERVNGYTQMTDFFQYETPFGFLGQWFDKLFLKRHMMRFLLIRNTLLKESAEQIC